MSNPWFRLYSEIVDDWKIRSLAFEDRWHYVAILCLKNAGELDKDYPANSMMEIKLGLTGVDLTNMKKRLIALKLIDDDWQPTAWGDRQYESDSSRERTRKYRERNKKRTGDGGVTSPKRHRDAVVTAQDTDTDTDTDNSVVESVVIPEAKPPKSPATATKKHPVENWTPTEDIIECLKNTHEVPDDFIRYSVAEFILYWSDREPQASYGNKFLSSVVGQWRKHGDTWNIQRKQRTRDRTLRDDLTDRSWAS